jgi:hypothetical protein
MLKINIIEWLGYIASILVAVSLMMRSIVKLRIINTVGAICFTGYGFAIQAMPVAFINLFIIFVNSYYLYIYIRDKK